MIYLDFNATTPLLPEVYKKLEPWLTTYFANPASKTHVLGNYASDKLEEARQYFADFLSASSKDEITFTSGATESINTVLKGIFFENQHRGNHFLCLATEHKAVLDTLNYLQKFGLEVSYVPVNKYGIFDLDFLNEKIRPNTIACIFMWANNETGVINPVDTLVDFCKRHSIISVCDASQAIVKIPVSVSNPPLDVLIFSGHKFYAMKGIGGFFARRKKPRIQFEPLIHGGGHENGKRSGTVNLPGVLSMQFSLDFFRNKMEELRRQQTMLKLKLEQVVIEEGIGTVVAQHTDRLPNTSMLILNEIMAERLITQLPDVAFSTGSACNSAEQKPSHVLKAMGFSDEESKRAIRISTGYLTTAQEMDLFCKKLLTSVSRLIKDK